MAGILVLDGREQDSIFRRVTDEVMRIKGVFSFPLHAQTSTQGQTGVLGRTFSRLTSITSVNRLGTKQANTWKQRLMGGWKLSE